MAIKIRQVNPPSGFSRLLWRAPIWIYRAGFGWIMGNRFLLLNHIGRKSGLPRQAVLEVVDFNVERGTYTVASGFGAKSDWYQNLLKTPRTTIQVGREKFAVTAVSLSPEDAGSTMVDYARKNPKAAKTLMNLCGYQVDGLEEDYYILGRDHVPFMVLQSRTD